MKIQKIYEIFMLQKFPVIRTIKYNNNNNY